LTGSSSGFVGIMNSGGNVNRRLSKPSAHIAAIAANIPTPKGSEANL